jgi:hypothetical protein
VHSSGSQSHRQTGAAEGRKPASAISPGRADICRGLEERGDQWLQSRRECRERLDLFQGLYDGSSSLNFDAWAVLRELVSSGRDSRVPAAWPPPASRQCGSRVAKPILLVDDDADVRAAMAVDLATKGYEFLLRMKGAAMSGSSRPYPALEPDRTRDAVVVAVGRVSLPPDAKSRTATCSLAS